MAIKNIHILAILAISCFFLIGFVGAVNPPMNIINPGNMVFIGEQGLDITAVMLTDTQIGWWASGASVSTRSPNQIVTVSNPGSFSVFHSCSVLIWALGTVFHHQARRMDLHLPLQNPRFICGSKILRSAST